MKIVRGETLHPESFFTVKSLIDFRTLNRHKINTMAASNMKTCRQTKVWLLNPNLASNISYDRILNNFQNEAVNYSGVFRCYDIRPQNSTFIKVKNSNP